MLSVNQSEINIVDQLGRIILIQRGIKVVVLKDFKNARNKTNTVRC